MRTTIAPRYVTGLIALASLSAAACSSDDGGEGTDVPTSVGPLTPGPGGVPVTPGAPAPGAADPLAPGGVVPTTPGTEGQGGGTTPLVPGAPAPDGSGAPAPVAPTDGTQPPPVAGPTPAGFFASGAWSGPVVTTTRGPGTTVAPVSFADHVEGTPFCATGTVAQEPAFENDAGISFTLSQPAGATAPVAVTPTAAGIAVTFSRSTGAPLRVELSGADGAWCYELGVVQGQAFISYAEFNTVCWPSDTPGQAYNREPITTLSFEVPGRAVQGLDYDVCVAGFADAAGIEQAPPVPDGFLEPQLTGTLSENFGRAIVSGADGKKYLVSNNAWGPGIAEGSQVINYVNNSFTIMQQNAGGNGSQVLTFPFVSVGRGGGQGGNASQTTTLNDNLPKQISAIQSVRTRFAHNIGQGGIQGNDFNATYDVWFAANPPVGEYGTASGAFLMVWTHIPNGRQPIGQVVAQNVTLEGQSFQLWVGRRDEGLAANGEDGASPVISYVSNGTINDYDFDLNVFIQDAVQRASSGGLRGLAFGSNLYLTDVYAGFEIWNGGQGLSVTNFEVNVQ
jgi:hypothetical protein